MAHLSALVAETVPDSFFENQPIPDSANFRVVLVRIRPKNLVMADDLLPI